VRLRALAYVSALTAGDYMLWNWSVGGAHDIVALASGLTLLPLAAVCFGLLVLACLQMLARSARRSTTMTRAVRTPRETRAAERPPQVPTSKSSSERLAA